MCERERPRSSVLLLTIHQQINDATVTVMQHWEKCLRRSYGDSNGFLGSKSHTVIFQGSRAPCELLFLIYHVRQASVFFVFFFSLSVFPVKVKD